jgi:carbamoyltransferase
MTMAYDCTEFAKRTSPAMVHVDGTARPQLVRKAVNPAYYRILELFEQKTGVPCLINTSFNMHEEPIVCTPQDAVDGFLRSRIDYLAMEDRLVPLPEELRLKRPQKLVP